MSKRELLAYLLENNTNFSLAEVCIGSGVAIVLAFFLYFVYKKTYDSVKYSKSFNVTLLITTIVTTMVMMIIGSNLALSLGMVGALSIIRFRTAIKDPKDIAFIFWAVAIGLSCGSGIYAIGIVGSIIIAAILFLVSKSGTQEETYLLTVQLNADASLDEVEACLKENLKKFSLKVSNTRSTGTDATYEIRPSKMSVQSLCALLQDMDSVNSVSVVAYEGLSR